MRKALVAIVLLAALAYAGAVGYLISQETNLVFRAGNPLAAGRPSAPFEQVDLPRDDGARQFGWVLQVNLGRALPVIAGRRHRCR